MTDIDDIRKLYNAATQGEWKWRKRAGDGAYELGAGDFQTDGFPPEWCYERTFVGLSKIEADPALVVALRNSFPALAEELEAARKVVAAARAMSANENHAMHRACYICDETWLTLVEYDRVMEKQR